MLEHVHAEPEQEIHVEQAPTGDPTNPEQVQGKPRCIPPINPFFYFESLPYNKFDCVLSL
jgi:hypothetical protein